MIASSTMRLSGEVCAVIVAFSGVPPDPSDAAAVEVAAAEKFAGIVMTAS